MRLLHTADWHVGKTIAGQSRTVEHEEVLAEIADVARAHEVDAILVAGDLFDSAAPAPDAERVVYRALLALAHVAPVVIVPGNHDSERRLAAVQPVFDHANVTIRAFPERAPLELRTRSGELLRVATLPWLSQRYVVKAQQLMAKDAFELTQQFAARARSIVQAITESFTGDAVNVVAGHVTIAGGELGGGERTAQTIFDYWVDSSIFPGSAHYVALGHLHKPQSFAAACPIRYSGSPLQLDFGDNDDAKQVVIVEAERGVPATANEVPLTKGRRLRTIEGTMDQLATLAGKTGEDFLRVRVNESARVGLGDEVRDLFPHAVKVIVTGAGEDAGRKPGRRDDVTSPRDLFKLYLGERDVDDDRLVKLFDELYEEADAPAPA